MQVLPWMHANNRKQTFHSVHETLKQGNLWGERLFFRVAVTWAYLLPEAESAIE